MSLPGGAPAVSPVAAERDLRARLARDPNDGDALTALGALLLDAGKFEEAEATFRLAAAQAPDSRDVYFNLGEACFRSKRYDAAVSHFEAARRLETSPQADTLGRLAACYLHLDRRPEADAALASLNPALPAAVAGVLSQDESTRFLDLDTASLRLLTGVAIAFKKHDLLPAALRELWQRGEGTPLAEEMLWLPMVLAREGKHDEAAVVYLEGLARGYPVVDYRPRNDRAALASVARNHAEAIRAHERKKFLAGLAEPAAKARVAPSPVAATTVVTQDADLVAGGAVLCGVIATRATGARYRFEYGASPEHLDRATNWRPVPPPRTGRVIDRAERMFNHWVPRSTKIGWHGLPHRDGLAADDAGHMALMLMGPFAKDRNQLNGIGSHEMPLNWVWCHPRHESAPDSRRERTLSVNGGTLDLRDAELTFIVKAGDLHQRGAALTFWILASGKDDLGSFGSQWALTGDPFPDAALAPDGRWHKVVLNLPSDPRFWTYTGNNPKEQGVQANRYRRLPLNETIARNDGAFVLIFAHGDERDVPSGNLSVLSIAGKFRDHSLLAPAAGARLAEAPASAVADPAVLTEGSRGYDDGLWTSDAAPAFPLEFRWTLPRPVTVSSFQINQHPYFPSKDVEILGRTADGWQTLWRGDLPDSASDLLAVPYVYQETMPGPRFSEFRLRIHSAHHPDRCGLDGFEIFGDGAVFAGDGATCTILEEIGGLAAGTTTYFRLVLEDGAICAGETRAVALPPSDAPVLFEAVARNRPDNPRCYVVRGNAMGLEAELAGELRLASGEVLPGPTFYFGCQPTGRHSHYNIPETWPERPGVVRLTLRNLRADAVLDLPWPPVRR